MLIGVWSRSVMVGLFFPPLTRDFKQTFCLFVAIALISADFARGSQIPFSSWLVKVPNFDLLWQEASSGRLTNEKGYS